MKILTLVLAAVVIITVWYGLTRDRGFITSNEDTNVSTNFLGKSVELPKKGKAPEITGIDSWINSEPLSLKDLKGKVVLVDFWTYSCINCIRTLPHTTAWYETYKDDGFVLLGIHSPEFEFEKDRDNVVEQVKNYNITYPVALDNNHDTWRAFKNQFWPAHYLLDVDGNIRYTHFGEGKYAETESAIQQLLLEAGLLSLDKVTEVVEPPSVTNFQKIGTPEIYLGAARINNLGNGMEGIKINEPYTFSEPSEIALNRFYFVGSWKITPEFAEFTGEDGKLIIKYTASKAHLVLNAKDGKEVVMEVKLDGEYLTEADKGEDVFLKDGKSFIEVTSSRLYNLIDTKGEYDTHILELLFPAPGVQAFAYTFG